MHIQDLIEKKEADLRKTQRTTRIMQRLRAKYPQAQTDLEAVLLNFNDGQRQDRIDINRLDREVDREERDIDQLEKEVDSLAKKTDRVAESPLYRAISASVVSLTEDEKARLVHTILNSSD